MIPLEEAADRLLGHRPAEEPLNPARGRTLHLEPLLPLGRAQQHIGQTLQPKFLIVLENRDRDVHRHRRRDRRLGIADQLQRQRLGDELLGGLEDVLLILRRDTLAQLFPSLDLQQQATVAIGNLDVRHMGPGCHGEEPQIPAQPRPFRKVVGVEGDPPGPEGNRNRAGKLLMRPPEREARDNAVQQGRPDREKRKMGGTDRMFPARDLHLEIDSPIAPQIDMPDNLKAPALEEPVGVDVARGPVDGPGIRQGNGMHRIRRLRDIRRQQHDRLHDRPRVGAVRGVVAQLDPDSGEGRIRPRYPLRAEIHPQGAVLETDPPLRPEIIHPHDTQPRGEPPGRLAHHLQSGNKRKQREALHVRHGVGQLARPDREIPHEGIILQGQRLGDLQHDPRLFLDNRGVGEQREVRPEVQTPLTRAILQRLPVGRTRLLRSGDKLV